MFGLMKACSCNKTAEQVELQRLHYCGTCKTVGRLYGQKARVLLNYDAVFLGEVLSVLQPQPAAFAAPYVSRNCFSLPKKNQIPWALKYAATTNVILAELKVLDHIADTGSKVFKLARWMYSSEFRKASLSLAAIQFPLKELHALMSLQIEREAEHRPSMDRLSEPTAAATRLVFRHGAAKAGADLPATETMAALGYVFGEIAYLVDAIEDQEEDAKKGAFNALAATGATKEDARQLLKAKQQEMLARLAELPIAEDRRKVFASRLRTNLAPILLADDQLNMMGRSRTRTSSRRGYDAAPRPCCCDCCGICACDCCSDLACECCCCEAASCCDCLGGCAPC